MSTISVICFHGSPGTEEDFSRLRGLLRSCQVSISMPAQVAGKILLGYSWGAARALLAAVQSDMPPRAIILVSPYAFASKVSPLKRALLQAPVLGAAILKGIGASQMKAMAEKSAHPVAPSSDYLAYCLRLARPELLAKAILEKEGKRESLEDALEELGGMRIPVYLIWGKKDLTSSESAQIQPLREKLAIEKEISLPEAGHAIPWTHPRELAIVLEEIMDTLEPMEEK